MFSADEGARSAAPSARSARRSRKIAASRTWSRSRIPPERLSEDGRTAYATVSYDQTAEELDASARERLEDATAGLAKSGVDVAMSGEPIDGAATGGFPIGEVIGLAIAIVLLIAVLRNLRARATRSAPRSRASASASAR